MDDLPIARVREIDYDARRDPTTDRHCVHCQKDLAPDRYARFGRVLMLDNGPILTIHPDDVYDWMHGTLRISFESGYVPRIVDDLGWKPFGNACARTHGVEWTIPKNPKSEKRRLLRAGRWRFGPLFVINDAPGSWIVLDGAAATVNDQVGWGAGTLDEAIEIARQEMPASFPDRTAYRSN